MIKDKVSFENKRREKMNTIKKSILALFVAVMTICAGSTAQASGWDSHASWGPKVVNRYQYYIQDLPPAINNGNHVIASTYWQWQIEEQIVVSCLAGPQVCSVIGIPSYTSFVNLTPANRPGLNVLLCIGQTNVPGTCVDVSGANSGFTNAFNGRTITPWTQTQLVFVINGGSGPVLDTGFTMNSKWNYVNYNY